MDSTPLALSDVEPMAKQPTTSGDDAQSRGGRPSGLLHRENAVERSMGDVRQPCDAAHLWPPILSGNGTSRTCHQDRVTSLSCPAEPPCTDPYARWCGRGGAARPPPIPVGPMSWRQYHARASYPGRPPAGQPDRGQACAGRVGQVGQVRRAGVGLVGRGPQGRHGPHGTAGR